MHKSSAPDPQFARKLAAARAAPRLLLSWLRGHVSLRAFLFGLSPLAVAVSAVAVGTLPKVAAERLLRAELERDAQLWQRRLLAGVEHGSAAFATASLTPSDIATVTDFPRMSDVYRMKLFDAEGRIFHSTRPDEIGNVTTKPYFFDVVAHGQTYAKLAEVDRSDVPDIGLHGLSAASERKIGEIYVPVLHEGRFAGAVEFYTDLTDGWTSLVANLRLMMAGLVGSGLAVSLAGGILMLRAARRREEELKARNERDAQAMAEQVRLSREVQLLGDLNEWLQSADSLPELFDMVKTFMQHLLPASEGSIYVYSNSRDVLDGWVAWGDCELHDHIRPDGCWGLRRGRTYTYGASEVNFPCEHVHDHDGRPYYCFPILAHGETVGLMHLRAARGQSLADFRSCQKLAQMTAEQVSMAIANVRMRDQLREQSIRDVLTGLFNRRHMTDVLRRFVERARREAEPVALLSLDVDHFKKFNDNHGHDAGDMVLRAVAEVLQNAVSGDEVACRPGGEEFAVILPGLDASEARARAEAIRADIAALRVRYADGDLPRITASIGVAAAPEHALLVQDLIKVSDEALYAAKAAGRNCVVVADGPGANAKSGATATPRQGDKRAPPAIAAE